MDENVRPKEPTKGELDRVGVEILDSQKLLLKCKKCGQTWSPNALPGGRMPNGYWKCPYGCNAG
jgi:hypothetical protein